MILCVNKHKRITMKIELFKYKVSIITLLVSSFSGLALADNSISDQKITSCDEYYNVAKGTFEGNVLENGHYAVKQESGKTVKTFVTSSITASCISEPKLKKEVRTIECADEEGVFQQYRMYIAQYNASTGKVLLSYPDGENWITTQEDCHPKIEEKVRQPNILIGLLKYSGVNATDLRTTSGFEQFKKSLDGSVINDEYPLTLIIDNMSKDKYNASNVTNAVLLFDSKTKKTGNFKIASVPQNLIAYSGYNGLNKNTLSDKLLISAKLVQNNQVEVIYKTITRNELDKYDSFKVDLFTTDMTSSVSNPTGGGQGFIYK